MEHDIYVMRACVAAYLRHIRAMDAEMRDIERRIRDVRARMEGLGVRLDGSGHGGGGDRMADGVAMIAELEAEWSDRVRSNRAEVERARDMCSPAYVGRRAVWLHVVEGLTWAHVGRVIGYSESQARRIADGGVRELYRIIPEEYRSATFPDAAPI